MSNPLPRVTYANVGVDLTAVHDHLDSRTPQFRQKMLGRYWPNVIAGEIDEDGARYDVLSPIDRATIIGTFIAGAPSAVARATAAAQEQFPVWSAKRWREQPRTIMHQKA